MLWFKIGCLILLVIVCLVIGYGVAQLRDAADFATQPPTATPVPASELDSRPAPLGAGYSPSKVDEVTHRNLRTAEGKDLYSESLGPGISIRWRSDQNQGGASLRAVVVAMKYRLQGLQQTGKGGDQIAKLIWDVDQLIEKIEDIDVIPLPRPRPAPGSGAGFPSPEIEP